MAVILAGKALAAKVKGQQREAADALKAKGITPCLAVVIVGEDPASKVYVAGKIRDCAEDVYKRQTEISFPDFRLILFAFFCTISYTPEPTVP